MNTKRFMKLGILSTSVVTPIVAVVACSPNTSMTEKDAQTLNFITGTEMKRSYTQNWLNKTLIKNYMNKNKSVSKSQAISNIKTEEIEIAKIYINDLLFKDAKSIRNLSITFKKEIKKEDEIELNGNTIDGEKLKDNLDKVYKMNKEYNNFEEWNSSIGTGKFSEWMNTYILDAKDDKEGILGSTEFKIKLDKKLLSIDYLSLSKDNWDKVFVEDKNSDNYNSDVALDNGNLYKVIDENNFPLNKLGVENKYAYKWEIKLDEEKSYPLSEDFFGNKGNDGKGKVEDIIKEFLPSTAKSIAKQIESKFRNKKLNDETSVFSNNNFQTSTSQKELLGFVGISTLPGNKGLLNFEKNIDAWINKTDLSKFIGFEENGNIFSGSELVTFKKLLDKTIEKTLYRGIIPTYKINNNKAIIAFDPTAFDLDKLKRTFAVTNPSLYTEAEIYYTDKNSEDKTMLEFNDSYIVDILKEDGLKFVEHKK